MTIVQLPAISDNFIHSPNTTTNYGADDYVATGRSLSSSAYYHTLLKANFSLIPLSATVTSATLYLWLQIVNGTSTNATYAYRLLRDWGELTSTWNVWTTGNGWATAGATGVGDVDGTAVGSATISTTTGEWKTMSLNSSVIQNMVNGTYSNYGFLLKAISENTNERVFYSHDYSSGLYAPYFEITYTVPALSNKMFYFFLKRRIY